MTTANRKKRGDIGSRCESGVVGERLVRKKSSRLGSGEFYHNKYNEVGFLGHVYWCFSSFIGFDI
jgi:hypothetical protein